MINYDDLNGNRRKSRLLKVKSVCIPDGLKYSRMNSKQSSNRSTKRKRRLSTRIKQSKSEIKRALSQAVKNSFRKVKDVKLPYIKDLKLSSGVTQELKSKEAQDLERIKIQSRVLKSYHSPMEDYLKFESKYNNPNSSLLDLKTNKINGLSKLESSSSVSSLSQKQSQTVTPDPISLKSKIKIKKLPKKKCIEKERTLCVNKSHILSFNQLPDLMSKNEDVSQAKNKYLTKHQDERAQETYLGNQIKDSNLCKPKKIDEVEISNLDSNQHIRSLNGIITFSKKRESRNSYTLNYNQSESVHLSKDRTAGIEELKAPVEEQKKKRNCATPLIDQNKCISSVSESKESSSYSPDDYGKESESLDGIYVVKETKSSNNAVKHKSKNLGNIVKVMKNPLNNNNQELTEPAHDKTHKLIRDVEQILEIYSKIHESEVKDKIENPLNLKISKLIEYLNEYFNILKATEKCITQTKVHKQAELFSITRIFNQIRMEIDSKEKLIKIQFDLMIKYFEEPLYRDLEYISDKCFSLCESLNTIMSAQSSTQSINKLKNELEEVNLDILLTREKVDAVKITTRNFYIQNDSSFVIPCLDYNLCELRTSLEHIKLAKISYSNINPALNLVNTNESKVTQSTKSRATEISNPKTQQDHTLKALQIVKGYMMNNGPLKLCSMQKRKLRCESLDQSPSVHP